MDEVARTAVAHETGRGPPLNIHAANGRLGQDSGKQMRRGRKRKATDNITVFQFRTRAYARLPDCRSVCMPGAYYLRGAIWTRRTMIQHLLRHKKTMSTNGFLYVAVPNMPPVT